MDSAQVGSNIRQMGRVQLLVELLHRAYPMLSEDDQHRYTEGFVPDLKGHADQYMYRMKQEDIGTHL